MDDGDDGIEEEEDPVIDQDALVSLLLAQQQKRAAKKKITQAHVDNATKEDKRLAQEYKALSSAVSAKRKRIDALKGQHHEQSLYAERMAARHMSIWWVALWLLSLLFTGAFVLDHRWGLAAASYVASQLVWRGLYVERNFYPTLLAVALLCITTALSRTVIG